MLTLPSSLRVFAKTGPTDMRKSFEGLVGVVERELGQQVESGDLFLFFNRRGDRVKVLWFAGDGLVIWYKRLEGLEPLKCRKLRWLCVRMARLRPLESRCD